MSGARRSWLVLAVGSQLAACRPAETAAPGASEGVHPAATGLRAQERTMAIERLYVLGEQYFEVGDHARAVAVWRQVFLLLPADAKGDRLRHQLIARMAHGLMRAFESSRDPVHLDQGEAMLERYVAKHHGLFPDTSGAEAERAEIYELIGTIRVLRDRGDPEPIDHSREEPSSTIAHEFRVLTEQAADEHEGEKLGPGGIEREVVVPSRSRLASIEDPRVRRWLAHPSPMGPSVLSGGDEPYNPTRPLVRAGVSKLVTTDLGTGDERLARRQLRELVRVARPRLEQCYAEALSRAPVLVSKVEVAVTIDEGGRIASSEISDGRLVDAVGDACVLWALMGAEPLPRTVLADRVTLELPVTFFLQHERVIAPSMIAPGGFDPGDVVRGYDRARLNDFDSPP